MAPFSFADDELALCIHHKNSDADSGIHDVEIDDFVVRQRNLLDLHCKGRAPWGVPSGVQKKQSSHSKFQDRDADKTKEV
jgi:hypothetical protein